jgi:hypothetical protein
MTDPGRVPIAGPVFTEWYWTPIFLAIVYGPPILAVAGGLYLALRRTRLRRVARAAVALVLAPALVIGGVAVWATAKHRRTEAADARAVRFATFAAPDLHQTRADVFPDYGSELHLRYERGGGELLVSQVAAEDDDLTPPRCDFHDGTPFVAWEGPCRSARTPRGRVVTAVEMQTGVPSVVEVRDGTLIVAGAYVPAGEADLLALADALRPVDVEDIGWER